jgi:cell wall-associated NlpC family hydrolase
MRRALLAVAALAVAGAFGMVLLPVLLLTTYSGMSGPEAPAACGAPSAAVGVEAVNVNAVAGLSADQLHNAGIVIAVGQQMGLDVRGQTIGVMVALGESGLVNIDVGDAAGPDSRGLFQQRAEGWGTYAERMDPATASRNFYKALQGTSGWEAMSATGAAHAVQRNADPNYYTRYFDEAGQIVANATGQPAAAAVAVTCTTDVASAVVSPGGTAAAQVAVAFAMARRGQPYLWGGTGPLYDCSGLTQAAYASAGVVIARDTYGQVLNGVAVNRDQVQPGDLWFPEPGHVELVISATQAVEDPHTGDVIKVSPLGAVGVFRRITA